MAPASPLCGGEFRKGTMASASLMPDTSVSPSVSLGSFKLLHVLELRVSESE